MKKGFVIVLFFLVLSFALPLKSFAQTPDTSNNIAQTQTQVQNQAPPITATYPLNTDSNVPQNFHTYTQSVFIEILGTAVCFISGQDILDQNGKCLGVDLNTKKIGYVSGNTGGLMMAMGGLIGSTYNIPISTSQYGHYLASNFGITRNSYAAQADPGGGSSSQSTTNSGLGKGIGFTGLESVLPIWQAFRNLTYLVFVIIFVLLGLGIMFRVNIDARTVMTIQNQIPKIVIGLILITLSYAIAGLLIDLMYISIYLVIHIFADQNLTTLTNIPTNPVDAVGYVGGIASIAGPAAHGVGGLVSSLFNGTLGGWLSTIATTIMGAFIGGSLGGGLFGGLIGGAIGFIGGLIFGSKIIGFIAMVIAYLIISIALLSALFRVWFMLIKAYIFIFLDVIFGPFWILGGLLPGAPGGFVPWLRSLISNLAAFPVVIVLFMIGKSIQDLAANTHNNFVPPLIGNPGSNGDAIASIIGLGIILIMPEAVNITKSTLKAPDNKLANAAFSSISAGKNVVTQPISGLKGELFGKDALGKPRAGSKLLGSKFGSIVGGLSGGSFHGDAYGGVGKFRIPHPLGPKVPGGEGKRARNIFGRKTKEQKDYESQQAEKARVEAEASTAATTEPAIPHATAVKAEQGKDTVEEITHADLAEDIEGIQDTLDKREPNK